MVCEITLPSFSHMYALEQKGYKLIARIKWKFNLYRQWHTGWENISGSWCEVSH